MAKADKLKALRAARAAGTSRNVYNDDDPQDIYDVVDEDDYRAKRREDLLKDDFVIDDNGEGYVDTGADEWDNRGRHKYYSSEEEVEDSHSRKKKKVKKTAPINNFFKPSSTVAAVPKKKIDTNFDDILDGFMGPTKKPKNVFSSSATKTPLFNSTNKVNNSNDFFSVSKSIKKPSTLKKPPKSTYKFDDDEDISFDLNETSFDNHINSSPTRLKQSKAESPDFEIPVIEKKPETRKVEDEEEDDESEDEVVVVKRPRTSTMSVNRSINMNSSAKPKPENSNTDSSALLSSPVTAYTPTSEKIDKELVTDESTDTFKMYWLDYTEVENTLILFGKVLTSDKQLVSAMVQVKGFDRELYFLPRSYRRVDGEDTEETVSAMDVHEEVAPLIMEKFGLSSLKAKPETKKYAFEMAGIPKEKEYLKLLLPYQPPKNARITLPSDLSGETFSHVFGTNANIFETFVLQRNIMGPCWLEIKNADFTAVRNTSHCKVEVAVEKPAFIMPIEKSTADFQITPPPLTSCSISVQTMMNQKENKQEVVAITLATYRNLPQDAPVDENLKPDDLVTLTRPIGISLPPGLKTLADKNKLPLRVFRDEKTMLNCLAALVKLSDPDVFVGHRLENISLDIVLHRMHDLKVATFSTFGRRQRKTWPDRFGKNNTNTSFLIKEIFAGRLLCDISNEMGQSLTTKCQSWDLPEMYDVVCKKKHIPLEINWSNPQYTENANSLFMVLKENCVNCLITAEIAFGMQILSLSKQLTNLAGNAWAHTLGGTRAGRNEYILLHEFNRNGYIVPDKETRQQRQAYQQQHQQQMNDDADEQQQQSSGNNKKSKYQGGLVFEPEKGLHKNYVLVMDFNSLYPSIIQEFNICFTTVDRDLNNIETLPDVPPNSTQQGVLPRLLSTLVNRRREVKKLMKDPTVTTVEKAQFDIKQQALKLTANSMYGCLGYVNSRFYAKPLAMLVTNKGREILMDTRQLAESLGLRVVYGDTDSVMIDTNCDNFKDAIKIGEDFKVKVNERYRLLEIDIDNIFKRLLLHAKKKYAAMNVSFDKIGNETTTLEVKGLDMKRREYCPLSKEISIYVLQKILSDLDPEVALNEVYSYLEGMASKIKNFEIRPDQFKINTKLSKDPSAYPGGKNMPAVQVALRLKEQGKVIKAGSVITFVITEGDEGSAAERARSLNEMLVKNSTLKPDSNYYLEKQIFAPVERLVERIEGIDIVRLAKSLGLEHRSKQLTNHHSNGISMGILQPLESTIPDSERFKNASHLFLSCKCGNYFKFGGIVASHDYQTTFNGIQCKKCSNQISTLGVSSQLEHRIRSFISKYYQGIVICDDSTCGMTTKQISVYGKRCLSQGCKGVMRYKYSDKDLYNQLLYFDSLFDITKNRNQTLRPLYDSEDKSQPVPMIKGQIDALSEQNRESFNVSKSVVQKYLSDCGRRYVDMGSMFDFMNK